MSSQVKTNQPLLPEHTAGRTIDPRGMLRLLLSNIERLKQERPLYTGVPTCLMCRDELWIPGPGGNGVVRCSACGPKKADPTPDGVSSVTGSRKVFGKREGS